VGGGGGGIEGGGERLGGSLWVDALPLEGVVYIVRVASGDFQIRKASHGPAGQRPSFQTNAINEDLYTVSERYARSLGDLPVPLRMGSEIYLSAQH